MLVQTAFAHLHLADERAVRDWILMVMIPSAILSWAGVYFSSNMYLLNEATRLVDEHVSGAPEEFRALEFKAWMAEKLMGVVPKAAKQQ